MKPSPELIAAFRAHYWACVYCLRSQEHGTDHEDWCEWSAFRQMVAEWVVEDKPRRSNSFYEQPEVEWFERDEGLLHPTWTTAENHGRLLLPIDVVMALETGESILLWTHYRVPLAAFKAEQPSPIFFNERPGQFVTLDIGEPEE